MGFLNFLLKRQQADGGQVEQGDLLLGQAYEATVASSPPILGTFPVPGNGTNPMLIAANQQKLQVALNTGNSSLRRMPLSRIRSSTMSRPGTAMSASQAEGLSSRPQTSSGPGLAPRLELYHHAQAPSKEPTLEKLALADDGPSYKMPPRPWVDHEAPKRNSLFGRSSTLSSGSSVRRLSINHSASANLPQPRLKPHVDLLDAQSTIKPLDFYDRVKAAGARNYGEDVAERNQMQALATSKSQPEIETDDSRIPRKRHSMGHNLRTSPIGPQPQLPRDTDEASINSDIIAKEKAAKAARRQSMPASTFTTESAEHSAETTGAKKSAAFPASLREKAAAMAQNELAILRATAAMPQKTDRIRLDETVERTAPRPHTSTERKEPTSESAAQWIESRMLPVSAHTPEKGNYQRPRNASGASLTMSSIKQFDLDNPVPDRSSSLRNWSLTSGSMTAYTHDYESSAFRPQSSHTANTSVDLTPTSQPSKVSSTASTSSAAPWTVTKPRQHNLEPATRYQTLKKSPLRPETLSVPSEKPPPVPPKSPLREDFNIDDYVSSDDSFGGPKRNRGNEEADLLFSDESFGHTFQLPGIQKSGHKASVEPMTPTSGGETLSLNAFNDFSSYSPSGSFGQASTTPAKSLKKATSYQGTYLSKANANFRMPTFSYGDSDEGDDSGVEGDSEDDWSLDIPTARPPPSHQHQYQYNNSTRHISRQGQRSVITEEGIYDYYSPNTSRPRHGSHGQVRVRAGSRAISRGY